MTGDFLSSHASAIWPGVTPSCLAAEVSGLPALAKSPSRKRLPGREVCVGGKTLVANLRSRHPIRLTTRV